MALINCPECKAELKNIVEMCPKCGFPIKSWIIDNPAEADGENDIGLDMIQQTTPVPKITDGIEPKGLAKGCVIFFIELIIFALIISVLKQTGLFGVVTPILLVLIIIGYVVHRVSKK